MIRAETPEAIETTNLAFITEGLFLQEVRCLYTPAGVFELGTNGLAESFCSS